MSSLSSEIPWHTHGPRLLSESEREVFLQQAARSLSATSPTPAPWLQNAPHAPLTTSKNTQTISQEIDKHWRKFGSQTSNLCSNGGEKSQARERVRRERVRRKKIRGQIKTCEKEEKPRNTVFFQYFVARERRKVGSLERRVRSHLGRWEIENCSEADFEAKRPKTSGFEALLDVETWRKCARLWREAHLEVSMWKSQRGSEHFLEVEMLKKCTALWRKPHFQVKMYTMLQPRGAFGSWDVENVQAIVARSTVSSQNVQNASAPEQFGQLRRAKNARRCGAKHMSKWTCHKHTMFGPLFDVQAPFRVVGAMGSAPVQNWEKRAGFLAVSKLVAAAGHLKRICQDAFRVAGAVQETSPSDMSGDQGTDLLRFAASGLQLC